MDGSNVHTSVVIELANQEEPEEQKTYKIDFNEVETPKDYVIDQIFCGENITVYALFEIPEAGNKKSENEILEIQNTTANDEFRFIHKNSFKNTIQKKPNVYKKKLSVRDSEEDEHFLPKNDNQNRSFHCLKHLGENYEIPCRGEDSTELKVLFSKDFMSKVPKHSPFKSVSKGVNTEITQSPRLIEEVQNAISANYSCGKTNGKTVEIANIPSGKPSYDIIDVDMQPSFSSFSSVSENKKYCKKSSPNFLFVPLIMMEDRFRNPFRKDRNQTQPEEKRLEGKTRISPTKVSLGTNTDVPDFSPMTSETEDRRETKSQSSSQYDSSKTEKTETPGTDQERENRAAQLSLKKKDKDTILNEIRKLQGKLNALVKSIEYNDIYISTNEDDDYPETETKTSEEVTKTPEDVSEPLTADSEPLQRNKFDDIPIFSPLTFALPNKGTKFNSKKKTQNTERDVKKKTSVETAKSVSSGFVSHQEEIFGFQSVQSEEKPKVKLKNVFSGLNINWESAESWKGVGISKSDANNRCSVPVPKYNCLKKSVSFDLRDDKVEIYCLKKMKNSSFNFEGGLKGNLRIIQNGEVHLGDNLPSISREMGDEAKRKLLVSRSELQNFNKEPEREEINECLKNSKVDVKKSLNEEEGDAKLIYPKQSLISQKFIQNPAVHYCSTNTVVSDGLLKSVKNVIPTREKSKTVSRSDDSATRACSDPEKPTTPKGTCRKTSAMDSNVKKEVKTIKKLSTRNKTAEKKVERKEVNLQESIKPKSVSGSRKFAVKGTAESKLHVDKLIKRMTENNCKLEPTNSCKTVKSNTDEKPGGKLDRLPRPWSQKRELRESTPEKSAAGKRETEKKLTRKKSIAAVEAEPWSRKSLPEIELKENVSPVMVFESAKELVQDREPGEKPEWLSTNPSSVVVELFSKKPTSVEEFYAEVNHEQESFGNVSNEEGKGSEIESRANENSGSQEKPIVKSVWALTKVLLYEDGTKKLEVLEASLTPPGYCLKPTDKCPAEQSSN